MLDIISGKDKSIYAACMRFGLGCLTPIYRMVIGWRNRKFDRAIATNNLAVVKRAAIPVISVGNLTTGGTGKTPHVIAIARRLRSDSIRVVLISRGYGTGPDESRNDEAMEMEHRLPDVPHLQDPDRHSMAKIAVEELESQVVLLDDGFQHRQLHRDVDVVIVDATLPFGYGRVLPRGLLREPIASLSRADWVIISRTELVSEVQKDEIREMIQAFVPGERILESRMKAQKAIPFSGDAISMDALKEGKTFALCAIGNPENFFSMLKNHEVDVVGDLTFPDHHRFSREDLLTIGSAAKKAGVNRILCTHKDLVKIGVNQLDGIPVFAVIIDVEFVGDSDPMFETMEFKEVELI